MYPVLFHIGGLPIRSYGVMMAVGFLVAGLVGRYRLTQQYKNPDLILDFALAAVVGGIVGARLFFVIGNWSNQFKGHLGKIFMIQEGGLVFYGGLILGLALVVAVGLWKKVRFWSIMDLAGLCVPLALVFGRVGCFLNGCCYGKVTTLPWGVTFQTALGSRHPTQLYELVLDLALFSLLWWKKDSFAREGTAFWLFAGGYGLIRFSMEFLRDHKAAGAAAGAGPAFQVMSLALVLAAAAVLLFRYRVLPSAGSETL